jgi:hypothetical protein
MMGTRLELGTAKFSLGSDRQIGNRAAKEAHAPDTALGTSPNAMAWSSC